MRLFWAGFLMTGLLLVGTSRPTSAGSARAGGDEAGSVAVAMAEDGTGFPHAHPTPHPQP